MKVSKKLVSLLLCAVMVLGSVAIGGDGFAESISSVDWLNFEWIGFPIKSAAIDSEQVYQGDCGSLGYNLQWSYDTSNKELTISGFGNMDDYYSRDQILPPWNDYVSEIKSITVKNGVTSFGNQAFNFCTELTHISIPDSVTSIGYSFYGCTSLTNINIPDSVTSIDDGAFYNCTGLTSITIGSGVTSIGSYAFRNCTSLTSITVDENNKNYSSDEYGVLFNKSKTELIQYPTGNERTAYSIPDSVTSIGDYAFENCTGLTSITIPDSVTSIGSYVFHNCTGLTSITIPDSVTSIGNDAFYNCTGLTSITIPDSVTSIGGSAFENCTGLTSITIPDSVTSIGNDAFYGCTGLTSITIPDSVTSIGYYAFYGCTNLTSIIIPDSVTSIGNETFLKTAFYNDKSNWENGVLYIGNHLIEVDENFSGTYDIKPGTKTIGVYAFSRCTSLTSITIPDSVTSIGDGAFDCCTGLTSITIPDSVTSIGVDAFSACTGLTSITIPDSVTSISSYAFYGCTGLTSITIPDSVTSIGYVAFYNCTGLTSITIPDSVTSIGGSAFENCTGLTSITIPDSVTSIGEEAFTDCSKLENVTVPGIFINEDCFRNTPFLDKLNDSSEEALYINNCLVSVNKNVIGEFQIKDGTTAIASRAFYDCCQLTNVVIPDSVKVIGNDVFKYCLNLKNLIIPEGVETIGNNIVDCYTNVRSISIPKSVKYMGSFFYVGIVYYSGTVDEWDAIEWSDYHKTVTEMNASEREEFGIYSGNFLLIANGEIVKDWHNKHSFYCRSEYVLDLLGCNDISPIYEENYKITGFSVSDNNPFVCTVDGVLFSKDMTKLIAFPTGSNIKDYVIPNSVTEICNGAFAGYSNLESLTIPESVIHIGSSAFLENYYIKKIFYNARSASFDFDWWQNRTFPYYLDYDYDFCHEPIDLIIGDSVIEVPDYFFYHLHNFKSLSLGKNISNIESSFLLYSIVDDNIMVDDENPYYSCEDDVLFNKDKTVLYKYACKKNDTFYAIPETVNIISEFAIINTTNLKQVHLPTSLTVIGEVNFFSIYGSDWDGYSSVNIICSTSELPFEFGDAFALCDGHGIIHSNTSINIDSFDSNKWQNKFNITGKVSINSGFTVELSSDFGNIPLNDGCFSISSDQLEEGDNKITITAKDSSGVTVTKDVAYKKDVSAPEISFSSECSGWYKELNITGIAADEYSGVSNVVFCIDNGEKTTIELDDKGSFTVDNNSLPSGKHTVNIIATDAAGNIAEKSITYQKDTVGPVISSVECNPSKIWSKYVNVTINASDDESGLQTLAYSFDGGKTWQKSDTKKYEENTVVNSLIYARDALGNVTCYDTSVVIDNIDTASPIISFDSFNSEKWYSSFTIDGSVTDNLSGVAEISCNGTALAIDNEKFTVDGSLLPEGSNTVTVEATDRAGNTAQKSIAYKKDVSAPVVKFNGSYNSWAKSVTVTGTVNDSYSGVESVKYAVDSGLKHNADINGNTFTIADDDLKSGTHTLTIFAEDAAGNTSEKSITYYKDTTAPDVDVDTNMKNGVWTQSVNVTINAADDESGLAATAYSFDGGKTWQESNTKNYTENTVITSIRVKDKVGNIAEYGKSITIDRIDRTAPTVDTVAKSSNIISPDPVSLTVEARDTQSGIAQYSFDGGNTWQDSASKSYTKNTVISAGKIIVKDNAGNIAIYNDKIKIDTIYDYNIKVKVVDEVGNPVPGAEVIFNIGEPTRTSVIADSDGYAKYYCTGDTCQIGAIKQSYLPNILETTVSKTNINEVTIAVSKQQLVDGKVNVRRLTLEEIEEKGIDTSDPENRYYVDVDFTFVYDDIPYTASGTEKPVHHGDGEGGSGGSGSGSGGYYVLLMKAFPGGGGSSDKKTTPGKPVVIIYPEGNEECAVMAIIDLPVRASILKEFFTVNIQLVNNAPSVINVSDNSIKLNLPEGLTLMTGLEGIESSPEIGFSSFAGQETKSFTWIIRGDEAGSYDISIDYNGMIDLFDTEFSAQFKTEEPIQVFGLDKVTLIAQPDTTITAGAWYINVGLRNDSPVDIYMPQIETGPAVITIIQKTGVTVSEKDTVLNGYKYVNSLGCICNLTELPDCLSPGESLFYEYVIYNAAPFENTLYLKQAFYEVLSDFGMNVEISPITSNHFDMTNYHEKAIALGGENKNSFLFLCDDSNYVYPQFSTTGLNPVSKLVYNEAVNQYNTIKNSLDFNFNLGDEDLEKMIHSLLHSMMSSSEFEENIKASQKLKTAKAIKKALSLIKFEDEPDWDKFVADILKDTNTLNSLAEDYLSGGSNKLVKRLDEYLAEAGLSISLEFAKLMIDNGMLSALSDVSSTLSDFTQYFGIDFLEAYQSAYLVFSSITTMQSAFEEANLLLDTIIASIEPQPFLSVSPFLGSLPIEDETLNICKNIKTALQEGEKTFTDQLVSEYVKNISEDCLGEIAKSIVKKALGSKFIIITIANLCFKATDNIFNISDSLLSQDGIDVCTLFSNALINGINIMRSESVVTYNGNVLSEEEKEYYTLLYIRFLSVTRWMGEKYAVDYFGYLQDKDVIGILNGIDIEKVTNSTVASTLVARDNIFKNSGSAVERDPAPEVTINYQTLKTDQSFDSTYEYCFDDGVWQMCNGNPISITVTNTQQILRVRKAETQNTISGEITSVIISSKNTLSKAIAVNYNNGCYVIGNLRNDLQYEMVAVADKNISLSSIKWQNAIRFSATDGSAVVPSETMSEYVAIRSADDPDSFVIASDPVIFKVNNNTVNPGEEHTHSVTVINVAPTCTTPGVRYEVCSECNVIISTTETSPATGHSKKTVTIPATCTKPGSTYEICSVCGEPLGTAIPISPLGHDWDDGKVTKSADCTHDGVMTYTCKRSGCSETKTEVIPASGHDDGKWKTVTPATCSKEGKEELRCTKCDELLDERTIQKASHKPKTVTISATCTKPGSTYEICSVCGEPLGSAASISPLGHDWDEGKVTTSADCTHDGVMTYTCKRSGCDETKTEVIPASGHDDGEWKTVTPATCSQEGKEELRCTKCNELLKERTIAKLDHTPGEWFVSMEPTLEHDGKKERRCAVCNVLLGEESITKLKKSEDENTGVSLIYQGDDYEGEVELIVEESFDGAAFNVIDTQTDASQSFVYDLSMKVNGVEVQPADTVTVRIPIPEGFDPSFCYVYHINTETGKVEKMDSWVEGDFLVFETSHFSYYAVVEEKPNAKAVIHTAKAVNIDYRSKVSITATATDISEGYKIVLYVNGSKVATGDNKSVSYEYGELKSDINYTVKVVDSKGNVQKDSNGNELSKDGGKITCNAGFFKKLVAFFKGLFKKLPTVEVKP